jgi:hypothetical protein
MVDRTGKNMDEQLQENKQKILKRYIENLNDSDEHIRIASQVIDYL